MLKGIWNIVQKGADIVIAGYNAQQAYDTVLANAKPCNSKDCDLNIAIKCAHLSTIIYDGEKALKEAFTKIPDLNGMEIDFEPEDLGIRAGRYWWTVIRQGNVLFITFRGTHDFYDALIDASCLPVIWPDEKSNFSAHKGIASNLPSFTVIEKVIKDLSIKFEINKIILTGHSLGGGCAALCHLLIKHHKLVNIDTFTYTFGAPLVVAENKKEELLQEIIEIPNIFCFVNQADLIPRLLGNKLIVPFLNNVFQLYPPTEAEIQAKNKKMLETLNLSDIVSSYRPIGKFYLIHGNIVSLIDKPQQLLESLPVTRLLAIMREKYLTKKDQSTYITILNSIFADHSMLAHLASITAYNLELQKQQQPYSVDITSNIITYQNPPTN